MTLSRKAAIVGIGATEFSKDSGRSELQLAAEAVRAAVADAGLEPSDVDGLTTFTMETNSEINVARVAGLGDLTFFSKIGYGGGAACATVPQAAMAVATGGADVGAAFAGLPFDHLVFTGSTAVGRKVMAAAAPNLTPLTLELGGKSPAIVCDDFPLDKAAARIATGKWFNGGQTCIAPDYVLLPAGKRDAFVAALRREVQARYGEDLDNLDDYTRIVNDGQYARLQGYLDDAAARGVDAVTLAGAADPAGRLLPPTVLLDPGDDARVMQEEIFGPLLPLKSYRTLDEAIAYVNAHDRPLALYPFSHDRAAVERILRDTLAGGVSVNDTLFHFAIANLPFGGVGPSGMGAYHARAGFDAMSKQLPVLWQARMAGGDLLKPPYAKAKWLLDLIVR
jgi:coniferyl-aldehyde dehydrogenase